MRSVLERFNWYVSICNWIIKCLFFKVVVQWLPSSPMLLKTFVNDLEESKQFTQFSDGTKSRRITHKATWTAYLAEIKHIMYILNPPKIVTPIEARGMHAGGSLSMEAAIWSDRFFGVWTCTLRNGIMVKLSNKSTGYQHK